MKAINKIKIGLFIFFIMICAEPLRAETAIPHPTSQSDRDARLEYAGLLSNLHRYDESIKQYELLLNEDPKNNFIKFKLAEILSWQKHYKESIILYREILADDPSDIQVRRKYARVLMWMGDEKEAAKEFEKTLD